MCLSFNFIEYIVYRRPFCAQNTKLCDKKNVELVVCIQWHDTRLKMRAIGSLTFIHIYWLFVSCQLRSKLQKSGSKCIQSHQLTKYIVKYYMFLFILKMRMDFLNNIIFLLIFNWPMLDDYWNLIKSLQEPKRTFQFASKSSVWLVKEMLCGKHRKSFKSSSRL